MPVYLHPLKYAHGAPSGAVGVSDKLHPGEYDVAGMISIDPYGLALSDDEAEQMAEELCRRWNANSIEFQARVAPWMKECFGEKISADRMERNHRFLEEALELVQANGCTRNEAHQLVDYVYGRPVGDLHQEVGGVMVTLAALCLASGANMHAAAEDELARVWTKIKQIRAKQASKPKHSPLPA